MKLTLIRPNIGRKGHSMFVDGARMEPLALGVLAALTPPSFEVELLDDRVETIPYEKPTDLVAISVEIFTARRAYEIADAYRARGVTVILGGIHPSLMPEEAAAHADCVVRGDAEGGWAGLLDDFAAGTLKPAYQFPFCAVPQKGIYPRRELYQNKPYLPLTLLQFSRGCPNACNFCASGSYFDHHQLFRDVGEVVTEIRRQKRRFLFFVDDNIVANREAAKELFKALIPLKLWWVSQASMDMLQDEELMSLMVKSGCLGNVIGFESTNQAGILAMAKETNSAFVEDNYASAIKELRRYGLQTWAAFTVGHDTDTLESIAATGEFARRNKFCFAAFNILYPYPTTELYDRLKREGRLLYDGTWWLHPDYRFNHAAFVPRTMSPDELTAASFACRQRFNSPASILYRLFEPRTNLRNPLRMGAYVAYNPLFRREVFKKQDMTLGYGQEVI